MSASRRSCGICEQELKQESEDFVTLNGSCKHVHHAMCWAQRIVVTPSYGCPLCDRAPAALWDNPAELTTQTLFGLSKEVKLDASKTAPSAPQGFLASLWSGADRLLSLGIDNTHSARLAATLPIHELRHHGCTPDKILEELGTKLVLFLAEKTSYSTVQLRELGLRWEHFMRGGLTQKNFPRVYKHYGDSFLTDIVLSIQNILELCSNDAGQFASLELPAESWKLLVPKGTPAFVAMRKAGLKKEHLGSFDYTFEEWKDDIGLSKQTLVSMRLSTEDIHMWCHYDPKRLDNFEVVYGKLRSIP